jgi:hypothetical protein
MRGATKGKQLIKQLIKRGPQKSPPNFKAPLPERAGSHARVCSVNIVLVYKVGSSGSDFGVKASLVGRVLEGNDKVEVETTQILEYLRRDQAPLSENSNVRMLENWDGEEVWSLFPIGKDACVSLAYEAISDNSLRAMEPLYLLLSKSGVKVPFIELLMGGNYCIRSNEAASSLPVVTAGAIAQLAAQVSDSHGPRVAKEIADTFAPLSQINWRSHRPTGVLFHGPPGTGKSTICKAILQKLADSEAILFSGVAAQLNEKYVGESEKRLRGMTDIANAYPNRLFWVFLDEVHGLAKKQTGGKTSDHKLDTLLSLLEVMASQEHGNIIFLFATNFKEGLDAAFVRSKRVDRHILVPSLSWDQRVRFWENNMPSTTDFSVTDLAVMTTNFVVAQTQAVLGLSEPQWLDNFFRIARGSTSTAYFADLFKIPPPYFNLALLNAFGPMAVPGSITGIYRNYNFGKTIIRSSHTSFNFAGTIIRSSHTSFNFDGTLLSNEKLAIRCFLSSFRPDIMVKVDTAMVIEIGEEQFPGALAEALAQARFEGVRTLFLIHLADFVGGLEYDGQTFQGPARGVALAAVMSLLEEINFLSHADVSAWVVFPIVFNYNSHGYYNLPLVLQRSSLALSPGSLQVTRQQTEIDISK